MKNMKAPSIYRIEISDLEQIFQLSATPLHIEGRTVYILCHSQLPNSKPKKIAVQFNDSCGTGFDVYDYENDLEYINIPGQYPTSVGPALLTNIEDIYPIVNEMISFTEVFHNKMYTEQQKPISPIACDFGPLTRNDLESIEYADGLYSQYNIKATYENKIVGYIIAEEQNPVFCADASLTEGLRNRALLLNSMRWLRIRKIYFQDSYLDSGNLEDMFDEFVLNLPDAYNLLWCDTDDVGKYIEQIGGFTDLPKEICPNENIRIYSVYQLKNE